MMKSLVYHKMNPNFQEAKQIDMSQFELVAAIDYENPAPGDILDRAFALTTHTDAAWTENEKIWVYKEDARSTSIGDMIIFTSMHIQIAPGGFRLTEWNQVDNRVHFPVYIKEGYLQKFTEVFDVCPKMSLANRYQFMQNFARIKKWADSYRNSPKLIGHDLQFSFGPIDKRPGGQQMCYFTLIDKGLPYDALKINFHGNNLSQVLLNGAIVYDETNGTISTHT
ncbi:hypothetical protein LCGC14_1605360 [marine sediment metagenome]|uniref:Uncharacterized protein n=1 Tax=marine sediment metagenome TaxID=412755 RepID=A0A0F9IWJ0_9ZZZZ